MRILHVITMLDIGGAERLLVDILPLMRDAGHDVELLLFNGVDTPFKKELGDKGIKIHELSHGDDVKDYYKEVYDPFHIIRLRKYIHGYDIIHTHNFICQFYVALAHFLYQSSTSLVTTEHSSNNRRRTKKCFKPIDKLMYGHYASIICIADKTQQNLESYIGKKSNICTINNGVDVSRFMKPIKDISIKKEFIITMVAGLRTEKDHDTLLRAMTLLPANYHLLLVGDGVKAQELKELTKMYSISDKVTFMGPRMDIPEIYEISDIAVLSSHWEGLSLSSIEGMASGRPFIASDVDGLREIVGGAGFLFPHGDAQELANKIQWLCEHPNEYREVAKRCQERAKQYDISIMAENYLRLYNSILRLKG